MFRELIKYIFPFFFIISVAYCQHYTTPFGQNRIQYKNFNWAYYSTNNFDIYYYSGGREYALEATDFLEDEFVELTDKLGYAPYSKVKIFIYNSIHDFQQSNVGVEGAVYTIGGRTDFVKLQLELAYPGQAHKFKEDLIYKLSATLIQEMMYGGSLIEVFQNSYLLTLPPWFIDGAARYLAYGWSREMDDYLRDYLSEKKIKKSKKIENESASLVGQSIWNYIAIKYGESNISNILNLTRIIRKEENSITNTFGISFKKFLNDWRNYYLLQRLEVEENYSQSGQERLLKDILNSKELITSSISFNKDADKVAYALLKNGIYQVYVTDLISGKISKITSGGYSINGQNIDDHLPLLDWQNQFTLGVITAKRESLYLNTFNIENGRKKQKPLTRFRQIEYFSFNDNGRLAVISGDIDGQNDVFLIAMNRNALRRITHDVYDDLDPVFVPGTAAIIFSSNRVSDSIKVSDVPLETLDKNFNLFVYDLDTTRAKFHRLTNTYSENRKPYAKSQYEIYFLSDRQGISNLYYYDLFDSLTFQVTNFDNSIISYDLHFDPDRLTYIMLDEGENKVYLDTITSLYSSKFTLETPRKKRKNAMLVVSKALKNAQKNKVKDEKKNEIDTNNFQFQDEKVASNSTKANDPNWIDTDNYQFEDETGENFQSESFFSKYRNFEQKNERIGPKPYNPIFIFNNLTTSFLWDPYRKFMLFMETEINDILNNYKIRGGGLIKLDFRQGDIFVEFQYLKYWLDFKFRVDRKTYILDNSNNNFRHKYKLNRFKVTAALPITHAFRVEVSPFFTETSFTNLNFLSVTGQSNDLAKNNNEKYFGGSISLIFDNTVEKSFNLYQGTRALIEYTSHFNPENPNLNFSNLRLDFRHYQKIHREITLANRLLYGKQMGSAKKYYLLGGMDNWLFSSTDINGEQDPLFIANNKDNSDILFNEFITNLRGLDYNEAFGSDVLVFNTELRVPLFQYLTNGPIRSNFLRNFQLTSFFDIGSVWTGSPPFKDGRPITRSFKEGPFIAEIVKFQNPWLGGFGFGLRTVLLGYYIKLDAAKPYIDGKVGDYRFYFTLGLDF